MPLTVRAKGVSISTATNWAFNYVVGELTPVLQDVIEWRLYPMHGCFCIASFFLGESYIGSIPIYSDVLVLSSVFFCKQLLGVPKGLKLTALFSLSRD